MLPSADPVPSPVPSIEARVGQYWTTPLPEAPFSEADEPPVGIGVGNEAEAGAGPGREAPVSKWPLRYMQLAETVRSWSKDPSTRVGAVVYHPESHAILPSGYNGFPRGADDRRPDWNERPRKYSVVVHAEANALMNCARHGVRTRGLGMATTFFPCSNCVGLMINAGIEELTTYAPDFAHPRWGENFRLSLELLEGAGIRVATVEFRGESRGESRTEAGGRCAS